MDDGTNIRDFLQLGGFGFSFYMVDHLNHGIPQDKSLTAICEKISSYHQLEFPTWTRLHEKFFVTRITSENHLFQYLNENSQGNVLSWLIFSRVDDQINVIHFGPFEKRKDDDFDDKVDQTRISLKKLKDIWLQESSSFLSERQKEDELKSQHSKVLAQYLQLMQAIEEQIEAKKRKLTEVVSNVWSNEEERKEIESLIETIVIQEGKLILKKIIKKIGKKVGAKIAAKQAAKQVAKQTAKQGAKTASKGVAKTSAKIVPFLGLAVGTLFAVRRLAKGDVTGAGLELASGAASCVPGAGTAVSLAIDVGLVAKDVVEQADENIPVMEHLKATIERIASELHNLFKEFETAKAEYDFVCEVLEDPGYDFEKLENDIRVVDEVLAELYNNPVKLLL